MSICAVIEGINVINMIVAEANDTPPENTFLVEVPSNLPVQIGYTYINQYFYDLDGNQVMPIQEVTE